MVPRRHDERLSSMMRRVLAVVGPTASGKSSVAEAVAARLQAEIVSCDSMQVYRGMDIGTAKVRPSECSCPVHMIDVCEVTDDYAVAEFQRDARACVEDVCARGKVAILCGGTGLYLDSVVDEMSFPKGDTRSETRARLESYLAEHGADALHALLAERDPKSAAEIHPNNTRRVVRALEMAEEGVSYAEVHANLKRREPHYEMVAWALTLERSKLYERIDARVDEMFERGLVDEVAGLMERGLLQSRTASQAIGYKEVIGYLEGAHSLERARELVRTNTRRYAKRQLSWLRRDGRARPLDIGAMTCDEAAQVIADDWRQS